MAPSVKKVYCVENEKKWDEISSVFSQEQVLGLDSEWVSNPVECPTSTLQLSTPDGICAVIRLRKMSIPTKLKELLANGNILKVGVGIDNDERKLSNDYNLKVSSWIDLRYLARENDVQPKTLDYLALQTVQMVLDKNAKFGNWNADVLTDSQIHYAAEDAFAAVKIFEHFENLESVKLNKRGQSFSRSSYIQQTRSKYAQKPFIFQESDR